MPAINMLPHVIAVKTKTTPSPLSSSPATYTATYSKVPALVSPASSDRRMFYDRRNLEISHSIFTATQISAKIGDIVTFGTRNFSIKGFMNILESARLFQIDALEITGTGDIYEA